MTSIPSTPPGPPLYICIECSYPVASLYTAYSSADDRSLGRGVRLTQCPRCKRFADKYVEHDFVVLFIDLVLIKPQVYRHLLFNRLGRQDDKFDPSIIRLGTLLLLFDVYLTWARIEKEVPLSQPIMLQYLFFLLLCFIESLVFHLTIRLLASLLLSYRRSNAVSTALLVSSCTKLFPILMVIWKYDVSGSAQSVGWAVVVNNVEALHVLLKVDYFRAAGLVAAGAAARAAASHAILASTGMAGRDAELWPSWVVTLRNVGADKLLGGTPS